MNNSGRKFLHVSTAFVIGVAAFGSLPLLADTPSYPAPQAASPQYGYQPAGFQTITSPQGSVSVPYQPAQQQAMQQAAIQAQQAPFPPPVVVGGMPSQPMPSQAPAYAAEPVIEGFADQVPLTVALQQILPQGYGYTLGDGVNPGQLVSWRGGKPWNVVMQDMLAMSGLGYSSSNNLVTVSAVGPAPSVVSGVQQPLSSQPMSSQPAPMQPAPMQIAPQAMMQQPAPQMAPQMAMQQDVPLAPPPMQPDAQQPVIQPMPMTDAPQAVPPQPVAPDAAPVMDAPAPQAALMQPQPLQIENPAIFVPQVWETRPGMTLRTLLQEWCARVNTELNWSAEYDYPVMASISLTGTFEEAVRVLLGGFSEAKPTPHARLHYNPAAGQSILIVEATGNNYGE